MKKLLMAVLLVTIGIYFTLRKSSKESSPEGVEAYHYANTVIPELMNPQQKPTASVKVEMMVQKVEQKVAPQRNEKESAQVEFRKFLKESFDSLPTLNQLQSSHPKDGFHHAPESVMAASEIFGAIADKIKENPKLVPDALRFYSGCAKNEVFVSSIRAVCLRNLQDWSGKSGIAFKYPNVPSNIQRIADNLPKHR